MHWRNTGGHAEEEGKMQDSWILLLPFWKQELKFVLLSVSNEQLLRVKVKFVFQGRKEIPMRWHSHVSLSQTLSQ